MYNVIATINGEPAEFGLITSAAAVGVNGFNGVLVFGSVTVPFAATASVVVTPPPPPPPPPPPLGTAPTNVTAIAWPTQALVSFDPPATIAGKTIVSYTVTGPAWVTGTGPTSPIMTQGGQGTNSYTVVANYSDGSKSPASAASNKVTPLTIGVASTSPYVYWDGVFYWGGDYSYGSNFIESYADQTGAPTAGADFMISATNSEGWQPFAPTNAFDLTPYEYIILRWKPTVANDAMVLRSELVGDKAVGTPVTLQDATYATDGKSPTPGVWGSYKIPLSAMGIGVPAGVPTLYKLQFTNPNGSFARTQYFEQIAFGPSATT